MLEQPISTAFRRGIWGGSPRTERWLLAFSPCGLRKLVRREPEVVRRVKIHQDQRCRLQFVAVVVVDRSPASTLSRG